MNCGGEVKGLVIKTNDSSPKSTISASYSPASVPTSQNNGEGYFSATIAGIIFFALVIFLGWQLLSWLFSLDWSSDGEPTRFRIPYKRR